MAVDLLVVASSADVAGYRWPCELRNQTASRTLRVPYSIPRVHTAISIAAANPPVARTPPLPLRNRVTYSNPSDPAALSRILSPIRGVLFPPIIVFPFIAINANRGRSCARIYLQSDGAWGMDGTVTCNGTWGRITRNASRGYCFCYRGGERPPRRWRTVLYICI